jgi:hypothetical protein
MALEWFIRFLHIFVGVMWVGGIFLWAMVIGPSLRKRVPGDAGSTVTEVVGPRVERYHGIAGIATVLTGFWLMTVIWGGVRGAIDIFQEPVGIPLGAGFVIAIGMLAVSYGFVMPAMNKLRNGGGGDAATLQKRATMGLMINMVAGIVALGLMALAVNLRAGV